MIPSDDTIDCKSYLFINAPLTLLSHSNSCRSLKHDKNPNRGIMKPVTSIQSQSSCSQRKQYNKSSLSRVENLLQKQAFSFTSSSYIFTWILETLGISASTFLFNHLWHESVFLFAASSKKEAIINQIAFLPPHPSSIYNPRHLRDKNN